ncbi:hypothetical protein HOH45_08885 [bacterium]|jgi:hypothetical protein|nr:hypothetical protein [bacterium]
MEKLITPGKFESQYLILKSIIGLLSICLIGCMISLMVVTFQKTRPIVILESDLTAKTIMTENRSFVGPITVENFTKSFIRHLNLFDSYKIEESIPIALNMMGPDLRSYYRHKLLTASFVQNIFDQKISTTTKFKKIDFKDTTSDLISVRVSFSRQLSYTLHPGTPSKKVPLIAKLELQKLPTRTAEFPYGLKAIYYELEKL